MNSQSSSDAHGPDHVRPEPIDVRQRVEAAAATLELLDARPQLLAGLGPELHARLLRAANALCSPDPRAKREFARARRRQHRQRARQADEGMLAQSEIRVRRSASVFATPLPAPPPVAAGCDIDAASQPPPRPLAPSAAPHATGSRDRRVEQDRSCYVCKQRYRELHFFYDSLCVDCGDFNHRKRQQSADLRGRVALVSGARVKIGYQAAIMLLRAGATVIATTRFARDAAARYAREPDFGDWGDRLHVYGLDLRHTPSVETFAQHLCERLPRLDFLLNNACQTVRRPAGFYSHLLEQERAPAQAVGSAERRLLLGYETLRETRPHAFLPAAAGGSTQPPQLPSAVSSAVGLHDPSGLSQLELLAEDRQRGAERFPLGRLDADLQQVDLRTVNSWRLALADVSSAELLEVQLVNAVAPFVLNARLKPLMLRVPSRDAHIVNVSAMEGQFYRSFKTDKHPHTNMAKAALNMMTRTSAADYVKDGIHMNSVDTGWVTDEDPAELAARKTREQGFHPPLDIVDGAARICDPIFSGLQTGQHLWGMFLKDYRPTDW